MKRIGLILFGLIVFYFIFLIRQDIIDNLELKREEQLITKKLQQENKVADELRTRLKKLQRNNYLEELARTRLGMIIRGETAYKVIK
jgi:cell division protein FtsB